MLLLLIFIRLNFSMAHLEDDDEQTYLYIQYDSKVTYRTMLGMSYNF